MSCGHLRATLLRHRKGLLDSFPGRRAMRVLYTHLEQSGRMKCRDPSSGHDTAINYPQAGLLSSPDKPASCQTHPPLREKSSSTRSTPATADVFCLFSFPSLPDTIVDLKKRTLQIQCKEFIGASISPYSHSSSHMHTPVPTHTNVYFCMLHVHTYVRMCAYTR